MLSRAAELVRRHDPDRFLSALFAPEARRETLLVLYAFNHELARAREVASNPVLALIRLQWWREVVEGAPRRHDVARPLAGLLESGALDRAALLGLVEAREAEADPSVPTLAEWRAYLLGTAGGLMAEAGRVLGAVPEHAEALRRLGAAYGAAGVLRSARILARHGRCLLPADVLGAHGLTPDHVTAEPATPRLGPVLTALAEEGRALLREGAAALGGRGLPRHVVPAALPVVAARRDLRRLAAKREPSGAARPPGDRVAMILAGVTGRLGLRGR